MMRCTYQQRMHSGNAHTQSGITGAGTLSSHLFSRYMTQMVVPNDITHRTMTNKKYITKNINKITL